MNKTKSKVLSLILASAMIVSSFSSLNFASAASSRENGTLKDFTATKMYLVSSDTANSAKVDIAKFIGTPTIETYDHDDADAPEFVSYTHASGDRLVSINGDGELYVKKGASGKEVITVTYQGDYERDDKDIVVRGTKDITIYADVAGDQFVAKNELSNASKRPDAYESAAANDDKLELGVYKATAVDDDATGADLYKTIQAQYALDTTFSDADKVELKGGDDSKYFDEASLTVSGGVISIDTKLDAVAGLTQAQIDQQKAAAKTALVNAYTALNNAAKASEDSASYTTETGAYDSAATDDAKITAGEALETAVAADDNAAVVSALATVVEKKQDKADADALQVGDGASVNKLAPTGSDTLKIKLNDDSKATDFKISVAKKFRVTANAEVNKKGSTTYITKSGSWDDDWTSSEVKDNCWSITSYDIALDAGTLTVTNGKIGDVDGEGKIDVDGGTVGNIEAEQVSVDGGSVGKIETKETNSGVSVSDGKVASIDAEDAVINIDGGVISGDVVGKTVTIDSDDEDISTTVNGNVTAKDDSTPSISVSSTSDAAVKVTGILKGEVTLSDKVTVGSIDADYNKNVTFTGFEGKLSALKNANDAAIEVDGDSKVTVAGKVTADTLTVDEDGVFTIDEGYFSAVDGEGTLGVPAGKLFIEDSMEDVTLKLTSGLVAGATAFQAYTDAVDPDDFTALGYTLEQKAANDDVDKYVIKTVSFAGVQLDKSDLSIAKGQTGTVTVSAYPTGTSLPQGASIAWDIDANDDYITMTTEGNVATIKVVDYNKDYDTDNRATVTASVVDEDGNELDDYVEATVNVTATALPQSVVTLDTTKPVTVGTNAVYQYIAKSSTGVVMSAASSDTQIATVELFNAADARGYKFQVKGVAEGTATITTTDANGATATLTVNVVKVNGTLKADTTTYTFAPGKVYDVKFSTTGTTAVPVVTVNGKVVSIAPRGNGVYRVTAQNPGTAYVVATVGNTHVSVKFVVANGAASVGVKGNNVSTLK